MITLSLRLRAAVAASHDSIERTPLALAMQAGTLSRLDYAPLLQQTWRLHAAVEPACEHAAECFAPLRGLLDDDWRRRHTLADDLRSLQLPTQAAPHAAVVALVARSQRESWDKPWALAGLLYVLEGSRLGSTLLAPALARGWQVPLQPGVGLDYHLHGLTERGPRWLVFRRRLDRLPLSPSQAGDVVTCAALAMDDLRRLYAALPPRNSGASSDSPAQMPA